MSPWRGPAAAVLLLALGLPLAGCGGAGPSGDGDCNARVRWHGATYRPDSRLAPDLPRGRALGTATVVDCDGQELPAVVEVVAVAGQPSALVVAVTDRAYRGLYVEESAAPSSWPPELQGR